MEFTKEFDKYLEMKSPVQRFNYPNTKIWVLGSCCGILEIANLYKEGLPHLAKLLEIRKKVNKGRLIIYCAPDTPQYLPLLKVLKSWGFVEFAISERTRKGKYKIHSLAFIF